MEESSEEAADHSSRRALLGGIGVAVGTALAGCSGLTAGEDDQAKIEQLEAELAAVRAENEVLTQRNAALTERTAELEDQLATNQPRVETPNLWGFSEETMSQLQGLADTWTDSVVVIDAITDDGIWHVGTGWVYDEGVIASNAHVVAPQRLPESESITQYTVWDRNGDRSDGTLLGHTYGRDEIFETREDIGFLSVSETVTRGRQMSHGVSSELSTDEPLLQLGHPYSLDFWTPSVGPFITHREPFFASNIPGQPGVSGSPVLDVDGDVIGMTWGGQYVRRPSREPGENPQPGEERILPAFEEAMNGMHSYMHRIHTAADTLI
ncbi:trypsin-like peptidase domain-containing protein [Halorubrum sp. DTA98]|uniref:trypsin-like peptidase domain-containing protein n=1 Tax=Halorubrum sp. DTA98 TaxID=3402163 RepID=UPI003AAAB379